MVVKVTEDTFEQEVLKSELPVLLDCYADWCGPCKMMSPVVDKMADVFAGKLKVCKLNVDEDGGAVMEYRIMSIPNFLFFKNGEVVKNVVGGMAPAAFQKTIEEECIVGTLHSISSITEIEDFLSHLSRSVSLAAVLIKIHRQGSNF